MYRSGRPGRVRGRLRSPTSTASHEESRSRGTSRPIAVRGDQLTARVRGTAPTDGSRATALEAYARRPTARPPALRRRRHRCMTTRERDSAATRVDAPRGAGSSSPLPARGGGSLALVACGVYAAHRAPASRTSRRRPDDDRLLRRRQDRDRPLRRRRTGSSSRSTRCPTTCRRPCSRPRTAPSTRTAASRRPASPRAFWNNLRGGATQGGSTITQQYAKNAYLSQERTYTRKFKEFFIAVKLAAQRRQGQDPRGLPQHHLLRPRRLRHPDRGADLLRQGRQQAHRRRGRGARLGHPAPGGLRPRRTTPKAAARAGSTTCSTGWSQGLARAGRPRRSRGAAEDPSPAATTSKRRPVTSGSTSRDGPTRRQEDGISETGPRAAAGTGSPPRSTMDDQRRRERPSPPYARAPKKWPSGTQAGHRHRRREDRRLVSVYAGNGNRRPRTP